MKKLLILSGMLIAFGLVNETKAQVKVGVNINIGRQPEWGPVGYEHVDYYYLPDIECYYYVPRHQFIYFDDGRWIYATKLPSRYRPFDIDRGYKVVINEPKPYLHFDAHRVKYATYRNHPEPQPILRERNDQQYWKDKGYHKGWYKNGKNDDRRDDDHDRGSGRH